MGFIESKRQQIQDQFRNAVTGTTLPRLGVSVRDGCVYDLRGRPLGPLAGAQAELTDTVKKHRLGTAAVAGMASLGAGALIGLSSKKAAFACVTFADGSFHEAKVKGKGDILNAGREVMKFNALATAAGEEW